MLIQPENKNLPITEELDFHYLLGLLPPLKQIDNFQWLPELFTIVGYDKLIELCKYAGGEIIQIPKLDELLECIEALQWFYDVRIQQSKSQDAVPANLRSLFTSICEVYDARDSQAINFGS